MRLLDHASGSDVVCMAVRVDHIFDLPMFREPQHTANARKLSETGRESQLLGQSQVAALHAQHLGTAKKSIVHITDFGIIQINKER